MPYSVLCLIYGGYLLSGGLGAQDQRTVEEEVPGSVALSCRLHCCAIFCSSLLAERSISSSLQL